MIKELARFALLASLLSILSPANLLLNDYLLTPKAEVVLDKISNELRQKSGISAFVIATTKKLEEGANLYEYVKQYEGNASKPFVILVFAPNAIITQKAKQTGRIGLIPSSQELKSYYKPDQVLRYFSEFIGSNDSNSLQSKYDLSVLQAYSELADQLADSKGIVLTTTLKDESGWILKFFLWVVRIGAVLLFWIYFGRPLYRRIRYGKQ
ncbi:MAG: hypothetical protein HF962_10110 [Sulfurovum sp.]|nr:hypothetical protein [Sulfurovum sp.]